MLKELVERNRSYRRFDENHRLSPDLLKSLINLARISPSSKNQQALKFRLVSEEGECSLLFPELAWAGYLKDWLGPKKGERPSAYVIILGDRDLGSSFSIDLGICAQTILLGAVNEGFGGCMIGSVKRDSIRRKLNIPGKMEILLVLALGKPVEKVVIDEMKASDIRYWRDENEVHHVPKRNVSELII